MGMKLDTLRRANVGAVFKTYDFPFSRMLNSIELADSENDVNCCSAGQKSGDDFGKNECVINKYLFISHYDL